MKSKIFKNDLISLFICIVFFTLWSVVANHTISLVNIFFFSSLIFMSFLIGKIIQIKLPKSLNLELDFPIIFLFGYLCFSLILFFLVLVSPLSIVGNYILVGLASIILSHIFKVFKQDVSTNTNGADLPSYSLAVLIISLVSTTLWTHDTLSPIRIAESGIVLSPWIDGFVHASYIHVFGHSHGYSTIQNIVMSNIPASIYHYVGYVIPALYYSASETSAYVVHSSFMVPMGLFLVSLSGYALIKSFWGQLPGVIAVLAISFLPDAAQQGIHNYFFSFHWLLQISPGLAYGIAAIVIAWIFVIQACRSKSVVLLILGYFVALATIGFKYHIFFANSFVLWMYPTIFYKDIKSYKRALWIFSSAMLFFITLYILKDFSKMPYVRLDFSSMEQYKGIVVSMIENVYIQSFFQLMFAKFPAIIAIIPNILMLSLVTLGMLLIAFPIIISILKNKIESHLIAFPIIILVNYLIMSVGLAFDKNMLGTPEELLHRPFVWCYFIILAWTAGGLGYYLLRYKNNLKKLLIKSLVVLTVVALPLQFQLSKNIQQGPSWATSFVNMNLSKDLYSVLEFVKKNSEARDIVQDAELDSKLIITALSERGAYVINPYIASSRIDETLKTRVVEIANLMKANSKEEILSFAKLKSMKWIIFHPETKTTWPESILEFPVYASGGYRLYKLY